MEALLVITSLPDAESARALATKLIEQRVAACVNILAPCVSIYRWEGKVERDVERLLVIKTTRERFPELRRTLLRLHPYQLPELLVLPVVGDHVPYMQWVIESTTVPSADGGPRPREC